MITRALSRTGELGVTTFGLGHMRPFSGTWGSLPPVVIAGVLIALNVRPLGELWWAYHLVLLVVFVLSCGACLVWGDRAAAHFGKEDPGQIVADETAGMCLALALLPVSAQTNAGTCVFALLFAFIAFRVFDIIKPWPIDGLQRYPGGWGVLLDDLAAGIGALGVIQLSAAIA